MSEGRYRKLLSNTLIYGVGTFTSKLLVFFMTRLYTECLTRSEYGLADLITNAANLLIPLAAAGICDAIFRFTLDSHEDRQSVFTTGSAVLGAASLVFLLASPLLLLTGGDFRSYAWLVAVYVVSSNFHSLCANYIRAIDRTRLFALQGILNTVLTIGFNILFLLILPENAYLNGVGGYVLSVVLADFLTGLFLVVIAKLPREIKPRKFDRGLARRMLRYSLPLIPTTIFWWITNVSDRYMLTWFCGEDVNGLYSAANKIPTLLILVTGVFSEAWQYSAVKEENPAERSKFYTTVFGSFQAIIFFGAACIIALARPFASVLYADDFYIAWRYIPVLVISSAFSGFVTFLSSVYMVKKSTVKSFLTAMTGALVNIVLNLILIPESIGVFGIAIKGAGLGAQGAGVATAISYITVFIVRAADTRKLLKFDLKIVRLALNTLLICAQAVLMLYIENVWVLTASQIVVAAAITALNAKPLVFAIGGILRSVFGRKRA